MKPGCDLGNDAAEDFMVGDLGMDNVGYDPVAVIDDGRRRFIAGRLDGQDWSQEDVLL